MSLETRINDLESRLAFQDDTVQTLNDVLVAQQRQIELLEMRLLALAKRQQELGESMDGAADETPPPHY